MGVRARFTGVYTLVATSAHHIVRMTVRVSAVSFHRDIDLTLPTSSTFAEILPELATYVELPRIHRPWEATTVGGEPLDMVTPLHKLKLRDGSVAVLRPQEVTEPPMVRDAAESLDAAAAGARDTRGLSVFASFAGCAGLAVVAGLFVSTPVALGLGVLALFALAMGAGSRALFAPLPALAGAAVALWVAGEPAQWGGGADPALGVLAGATTACVLLAGGAVAGLAATFPATLTAALAVLLSAGACGAWLPARHAPAALAVLACLIAVLSTPAIATRAAGLKVPRVPTAGEAFTTADGYQVDVDRRSDRAVTIVAAISCAVAACLVPSILATVWDGGAWPFAFAVCTAGALAIYAGRNHYPVPRAALTAAALGAVLACAVAVARSAHPHPVCIALAVVLALVAATASLWIPRVPELEPTTVVWFERAETAAIIAAIPLAVHLTGAFSMIRGL